MPDITLSCRFRPIANSTELVEILTEYLRVYDSCLICFCFPNLLLVCFLNYLILLKYFQILNFKNSFFI